MGSRQRHTWVYGWIDGGWVDGWIDGQINNRSSEKQDALAEISCPPLTPFKAPHHSSDNTSKLSQMLYLDFSHLGPHQNAVLEHCIKHCLVKTSCVYHHISLKSQANERSPLYDLGLLNLRAKCRLCTIFMRGQKTSFQVPLSLDRVGGTPQVSSSLNQKMDMEYIPHQWLFLACLLAFSTLQDDISQTSKMLPFQRRLPLHREAASGPRRVSLESQSDRVGSNVGYHCATLNKTLRPPQASIYSSARQE